MVAPFTCPECSREGWRDRITLARHYAFAHNKLFEMTDVTPEMLNMSNMELKKSGRRQSDGDVANQNNHVKSNKEYSKLEEEEDLEMKESVAALSVKSDSNFVQWQKSFGKHDAQSGKRRNREGESKEERRERKEKRRMERREAKRCEEEEEEEKRNRVKREGCDQNEKEDPAAKPLFSLMMQELGRSGTSVRIIKGEEAAGKVKEFLFVLSLFNSFY